MFFGKTTHSLDAKGRLSLPSKYRNSFKGDIFINLDITGEYAEIVLSSAHKKRQDFLNSFNEFDLEAKKIKIFINAQTYSISIDSSGRINIPQEIIKVAELNKEVTLVGNGDSIIIWNKDSYSNKFEDQKSNINKEIQNLAQKLSKKAYKNEK